MIVPSDDDLRRKEEAIPDATVRYPPTAARRRGHYHPNALPDYETSQALANNNNSPADDDNESVLLKPAHFAGFDARFWRAFRYALFVYILLTLLVGLPVAFVFKNKAAQLRDNNPSMHFVTPPPTSYSYANNFAETLLEGKQPQCGVWDTKNTFNGAGPNTTFTFHGASTRNVSATSQFFFNSNASLWMSTLPGNAGSFSVTMNPDKSIKTASLFWDLVTTDPNGQNSVCFDTLNSNGTLLDIQLPPKSPFTYRYQVTLQLPYSSNNYTVPLLSVSLPYFSINFGDLSNGPIFDTVNIQGSDQSQTIFTSLRARDVLVRLGIGEIVGSFDVTNSLSLATMDSAINASVRISSSSAMSSVQMSTGNGPLDAYVTLAPSDSPVADPNYWINLQTTNEPLNAHVNYDQSLASASVQLKATTQVAPAMVYMDAKYQGTFLLNSPMSTAHISDQRKGDPLNQKRSHGFNLDDNTSSRSAGWIGWGPRPQTSSAPGQGSISVTSVRDKVECFVG